METKRPSLQEARHFARALNGIYPWSMMVSNLSPSFNWDCAGMTEHEMTDSRMNWERKVSSCNWLHWQASIAMP
jgi:isocitrate lyase